MFDSKDTASKLAPIAPACAVAFLQSESIQNAAASKAAALSATAILKYVDALCAAGVPRTEDGVKVAKAAIAAACAKRSEKKAPTTLGDFIAAGAVNAGTIEQYRIRAVKLWYYLPSNKKLAAAHASGEVPVTDLAPLATPFASKGGRPSKKASAPVSASREDLDKTIADAIAKAKALSLGGFAAELERIVQEFLSK